MTDFIEGPDNQHAGQHAGQHAEQSGHPMTADRRRLRTLPARTALIAAALLALGVGGGATIAHMTGPRVEMAPAAPVAIRSLVDGDGIVTVRGKVAETYGPAFILADGSGRALVEVGRQHGLLSGDTALVSVGQTVTVQGRFRDGTIHASFLVGADGTVTALRPMGPPHGGPGGPEGPGGPGGHHGGPRGPEARGPEARGPEARGAEARGADGAGAPPPPAAAAPAAAPAPAVGNSVG